MREFTHITNSCQQYFLSSSSVAISAISMLERVYVLIFLLHVFPELMCAHSPCNLSCSMSLLHHCGALHGRHKTTPFSANSACTTRAVVKCYFVRQTANYTTFATILCSFLLLPYCNSVDPILSKQVTILVH